ncbi:MAG: metallophosphoesterase, partial [Clostridia bacterium]|nr:metallophosphoesterase [Clostridia bacterium]
MPSFKAVIKAVCLLTCCALLLCACGGGSQSDGPDIVSQTESRAEEISVSAPEESAAESAEISEEISQEPSEEVSDVPETPFVPVIRFAVASDLHISFTSDSSAKRFEKLFKTAYAYAEADAEYPSLDAVVLVGDLTNYGRANEFTAVKSIISRNIKDGTQILSVMGNHELYEGGAPVYLEKMDDSLDKHIVINGIHFIGISPDNENGFSASSLKYLRDELEKAASESDPDTPIIVFQHHHIKDTVYVSSEWYAYSSSTIMKILEKYPQVIDFSGHSHGPVNNPASIWQGGFTALGTGTLSYFEMTSGMSYGTIPPGADRAAQYYIVEISADNRVKIMPFDILAEDFFKTPSNTDDPDE